MTDRRAFTLIELLTVMVVLAVLAAIAMPRFARSKERAVSVMLKADLKYLASLQEIYRTTYFTYGADATTLGFGASDGVTVTIGAAGATGWSATATHPGTDEVCAIYSGSAAPAAPATTPGIPQCGPGA